MRGAQTIEQIYEVFSDPGNFEPVRPKDNGLYPVRCVDKRLAGIGGTLRRPGNSLSDLMIFTLRSITSDPRDAVERLPKLSLRPGGHTQICAFDHNLHAIAELIAKKDPDVMHAFKLMSEGVEQSMLDNYGERVKLDLGYVASRAELILPVLEGHQPDTLVPAIGEIAGSLVDDPPIITDKALAYVLDANVDGMVPVEDAMPCMFLDTHPDAIRLSGHPNEYQEDALALSAATAVLVARSQSIPIGVVRGSGSMMDLAFFKPQQ